VDPRLVTLEIDRLERARRSAQEAAVTYSRALTAASRTPPRAALGPRSLRACRAELRRRHLELSHRLDRVAGLTFATPCEAAPLAFCFATAVETLTALDRLSRSRKVASGGRRVRLSRAARQPLTVALAP